MRRALALSPTLDRYPTLVPVIRECSHCKGDGRALYAVDRDQQNDVEQTCHGCDGEGKHGEQCTLCGRPAVEIWGSGKTEEAWCANHTPTMADCGGIDRAVRFALDVLP